MSVLRTMALPVLCRIGGEDVWCLDPKMDFSGILGDILLIEKKNGKIRPIWEKEGKTLFWKKPAPPCTPLA